MKPVVHDVKPAVHDPGGMLRMVIRAPAVELLGRQRERDVLDRVLESALRP